MKNLPFLVTIVASFFVSAAATFAALDTTFTGPLYNPGEGYPGEVLTGGALRLNAADSGSITATFTRGGPATQFSQNLVLFIDSQPGGFGNSGTFTGSGTLGQVAAGFNGSARSTAVFGAPFGADFVLAVGLNNGGAVYSIGVDGVLSQVESFSFSGTPSASDRTFGFTFHGSSIGLTDPTVSGLRFYSSYVTDLGGRRFDSMESIDGYGGMGNTITFNNYHLFGVEPVPEPTTMALAIFGGLFITGTAVLRFRKFLAGRRQVS